MLKTGLKTMLLAAVAMTAIAGAASAGKLTIESWRNDDATIWKEKIIPAFMAKYPDIQVEFNPTAPKEYNAALNARLEGGTAGDIITCRPFDASLELFNKGHLAPLNDLPSMANFSDVAKSAWTTDDGKTTFCVPMGSVIHGFIYNKDIFKELGLSEPKTEEEFLATLDKIKANGKYVPLVLGTNDQWEAATMGFQNIGPNYWKGEAGRKALIDGTAKFTDAPYVDTFKALAKWAPYMGDGYKAQTYPDSQNLFGLGKGAIYAAGSWDISTFRGQNVPMGAFKAPPPAGAKDCYISDHTDIGIGMNAKTPNAADAKVFLDWIGSEEFANIFANALPGFFPLSSAKVTISDDVAQSFVSWRGQCKSTIRNSYQILSRGTPNLENELWNVSAQVLNGTMTPDAAAAQLEDGLKKWYKPHQK
ncbi:MAG: carbohydrate ABC transporter substrate-binding protein [Rhizobiales bacterium]|nr:carbohydrate ABC transporter substrate-binding protein [Hyphomicrobiales bacterium]MBI3673037.1 carbohydrate ABC transporter substrate-binding protein [Hyphomicrobiales bacterium]